ncbi:MAG TPA: hypothetical protein VHB02_15270 [Acidimicrobiales bacterium]|nr:hypothetical protein [Acidimicrobiales bacterium]
MSAYSPDGWGDLFMAAAGANAALSGLIFVGLSVNIKDVLAIDQEEGHNVLTGRAIEALVALLAMLLVSLVGLVPHIGRGPLAAFVLAAAAFTVVAPGLAVRTHRGEPTPRTMLLRLALDVLFTGSLLLAGTTLAAGAGGGLDWLPVAFVLAVVIAAVNAWVLLVEILR